MDPKSFTIVLCVLSVLFSCHLCQETTSPNSAPISTPNTTTTTPAPKTTTPAPKTTTHAPTPPPTPAPTPAPEPKIIAGNITEGNHTCLRYEFNIHLTIKYNDTNNGTKEVIIIMPLDSIVTHQPGICNASQETFSLTDKNKPLNLTLTFKDNENSVFLDSILLDVTYDNITFPNVSAKWINTTRQYSLSNLNSFNVEKTHSYFCANVTLPKSGDGELRVTFESTKLQAFMDKTQNGKFSSEHNCQNEINDVVPIAVGAALTGLVVIVMIAYFIGRRRSRRLAYQSV